MTKNLETIEATDLDTVAGGGCKRQCQCSNQNANGGNSDMMMMLLMTTLLNNNNSSSDTVTRRRRR